MATVKGTSAATPDKPNKETLDPITQAIAKGFESVLKDVHAMQKEMRGFVASIQKEATITADRMGRIANVSTGKSGLRAPAGVSQEDAAQIAVISRGRAATAHRAIPAHLAPGAGPTSAMAPLTAAPAFDPDAFQAAYSGSVQSVRASIANRVAQRAQDWAGRDGLMQDPRDPNTWYYSDPSIEWDDTLGRWRGKNGQVIPQSVMDKKRVIQTPGYKQDAQGRWREEKSGRMASVDAVRKASTGWEKVADYQRKAQISGSISNAANAWASGQGIGRSLLAALPAETAASLGKAAGIAGAVYMGARKAVDWSQEQFRKGRDVSQYTGGSTFEGWKDATNDQIKSWMQGWNPFGPGASDYMAFANRANQMGMRGARKEGFVGTGLDLMSSLNMGSDEASRIMSTVVMAGQSLVGLKTALVGVTKAARDAGISAVEARQRFEQNFSNMANVFGTGQTAKTGAAVLTNVQTQQGVGSQMGQIGVSYSLSAMASIAATQGMTVNEYRLGIEKGTVLPNADRDKEAQRRLASIGFTKELASSFIVSYEKKNAAGVSRKYPLGQPDSPPADAETRSAVAQFFLSANIMAESVLSILQSVGYTNLPDPNDPAGLQVGAVYHYALCVVMDRGVGGQTQATATAEQKALLEGGTPTASNVPSNWSTSAASWDDALHSLDYAYSDYMGASTDEGAWTKSPSADKKDLPVVKKFMDAMARGQYGSDPFADKTVMVKDKDGKMIEVDTITAISQYADQIQSGVAKFGSETNDEFAGKSIAEVIGVNPELASNLGVVKVEPSQELKDFFRIYYERVPVPTT